MPRFRRRFQPVLRVASGPMRVCFGLAACDFAGNWVIREGRHYAALASTSPTTGQDDYKLERADRARLY
jgi:hypothetical protein